MDEKNINNIINNFKDILQNNTSSNSNTESNNNSALNISPEMINNLVSKLKNTSSENQNTNPNSSDNLNFDSNTKNSSNNIDIQTVLKIKSIIDALNKKDDPRANLLYSLKPYLRESRKKKIDQYINLFKLTNVTNLFKNDAGDAK